MAATDSGLTLAFDIRRPFLRDASVLSHLELASGLSTTRFHFATDKRIAAPERVDGDWRCGQGGAGAGPPQRTVICNCDACTVRPRAEIAGMQMRDQLST